MVASIAFIADNGKAAGRASCRCNVLPRQRCFLRIFGGVGEVSGILGGDARDVSEMCQSVSEACRMFFERVLDLSRSVSENFVRHYCGVDVQSYWYW